MNFPLYLYPAADSSDLFARHETSQRNPNLNAKLVADLTRAYGRAPEPEDIFHYIYAVLYAPTYRRKYAEFLRIDFPRIPFTRDGVVFANLAVLGARLAKLHLLKSPELDPPTFRFEGEGDSTVAKTKTKGFHYDLDEQRIYINRTQYFGPIHPEVYEYRLGGYRVCEKWLKDRKRHRLDLDDIRTYCRITTAIGITITIQQEIDVYISSAETNLLDVV